MVAFVIVKAAGLERVWRSSEVMEDGGERRRIRKTVHSVSFGPVAHIPFSGSMGEGFE